MLPLIHCSWRAVNNPFATGLKAGPDLLLRQLKRRGVGRRLEKRVSCLLLSGLSGGDTEEGLWIRACDGLQSNSFTVLLHKQTKKRPLSSSIPTFQSWFDFLVPLIEEIFFFFFFFAGEWSGHVCQWQGSLFSLTLITSFTNLQIYYSTVCKGVNAITSSVASPPVMTTRAMKLLCWN